MTTDPKMHTNDVDHNPLRRSVARGTLASIPGWLHFRVDADELAHGDGRVVVFRVPARPIGEPRSLDGRYLMRSGSSLTSMTPEQLREVFDERSGPDHSAEFVRGAGEGDLDPQAIASFRELRWRRSQEAAVRDVPTSQLLADAELVVDGRVTLAALVLLGSRSALARWLPQAELIYEYRASEADIDSQERLEHRAGFLLWSDELWRRIDLRNPRQPVPDALVLDQIRTFNERVVRELLLNAVAHRDYRLGGSIVVRQFPERMEVVSPGGFLPGVTPENVLSRHVPRNRRIAEALQHCGLVERSGQGYDRIFRYSIEESKALPDFTGTDPYQVAVTIQGTVRDPRFVVFLRRIAREEGRRFSVEDLMILDRVHRAEPITDALKPRLARLREQGVLETVGRGRGQRVMLARRLYEFLESRGEYTRKRGLDTETNKALLVRHIVENGAAGSPIQELLEVLPSHSRQQVKMLLQELRAEGKIELHGRTRGGRWYPVPSAQSK